MSGDLLTRSMAVTLALAQLSRLPLRRPHADYHAA
jgi:hypothetical protein